MASSPHPCATGVPPLEAAHRTPRPHGCRSMSTAALLAVLAAPLAPLPAAAAGSGDGPSFSCTAAKSAAEKAICADPALAALDRRMANAYAKALAALDTDGRTALRADQRFFLEVRDIQMTQAKPEDYDLKGDMQSRAAILEAIAPAARAGWGGSWVNTSGQIVVTPAGNGSFEVSISTVQPYPSYPVCDLTATGRPAGDGLVVGGSPAERKANEGWTVTLTRKGMVLTAELVRPKTTDAGVPPFCGYRTSIDGTFLPMKPGPGAAPAARP